ncbi:MAG: hypothetical protein L0H53_09360 [Candidatus Nitrosocosmicus sp.]|nr:hypothetical protein [Candidatus Nitrosocosmicus sp.]
MSGKYRGNIIYNGDQIKYISINTQLRQIGVKDISISKKQQQFKISCKGNYDIVINKYLNYNNIYERTESVLLQNEFVTKDSICIILEFLESVCYHLITEMIKRHGD